ncbi:MAG: adenosylcobinamide-GDP ribazoletransferase [Desulfuromonadales bacterium]
MKKAWEELRLAGAFLTILPVADKVPCDPPRLGRSMAFSTAIGLLLGLGLVLLDQVLGAIFPRPVLDALLILSLIGVTGGLHLDGVADLADGLAGGKDREGILRIMKDSRVGAMGVIALVMLLLLKFLALNSVPAGQKTAALICMPAAGRWMQVVLAFACAYARPEGGTGGAFVEHVGRREALFASSTLLLALLLLFGGKGLALFLLLALAAWAAIVYFRRRLGGVTGDVLGAATERTEVFTLLLVLALFARPGV